MKHLLVTNDYPPKVGGIQSYLWELWRRLPPSDTTVLTTSHDGADAWDVEQAHRVVRTRQRVLLPRPGLVRRINRLAGEVEAEFVLLDPALPLGMVGRHLDLPYGVVLHGAEITVPAHLPGPNLLLRRVLRGASFVVAAGGYPLAEAERSAGRALDVVRVPPGVDIERFIPIDPADRPGVRRRLGLPVDQPLIVGVSRLVPRKGFDTLISALPAIRGELPEAELVIAGGGRDEKRLRQLAAGQDGVRLLGRLSDADLVDLYGCGDVFAMMCRNRWAGLEQEGFGIVFVEAAAAGVPQLAGNSGGAAEAVAEGETGIVIDHPRDTRAVAAAAVELLRDPAQLAAMGAASRMRAVDEFSYDVLAQRLHAGLEDQRHG